MAKTDHRSQRLMELKGIGPTTACALVASIGRATTGSLAGNNAIAVKQWWEIKALQDN